MLRDARLRFPWPPPVLVTPQPTLRASVTPASPGVGVRNELTTALYEFDVQSGFDNARLLAGAVPALEADIDLFLHQQQPDGTWRQVQAAESGRLTDELLAFERPPPGGTGWRCTTGPARPPRGWT
ncbi:MAG: hypothetical protein HYY54_08110 [candidate division NC10 bacterium]|nr:hypothetical protein [candidate division NC10 bacterium]